MKKLVIALVGSACVMAGTQAIANQGTERSSIEDAVKKARSLGYTQIDEIEADGQEWEIQGEKGDGKDYELRLKGKNNEVIKDEED